MMLPNYVRKGEKPSVTWANQVVDALKAIVEPQKKTKKSVGGSVTPSPDCAFGKLSANRAIIGGMITAGDKNFNVPAYTFDKESDGAFVVYITLPVEVNRDDNNTFLLPAIKTSSKTSITNSDWSQDSGTEYPDNDNPEVSDGLGEIILPIGTLTINTSLSTVAFVRAGCGNFFVGHCSGSLNYSRA